MLTNNSKKVLYEVIIQGPKMKEGIVLSEEEFNTLEKMDLIIERNNLVNINPSKITTIVENNNKHFFAFKEEENFILAEHLNEPNNSAIKVNSKDPQELLNSIENHVEKKEQIENKMKNLFGF